LANLKGGERSRYVQQMFGQIAPRYDLMNRLMTGGQDQRWRRIVIRRAALPPGGRLLDLGAGTGDLARMALSQDPTIQAVAADFTLEMMRMGRQRRDDEQDTSARLAWAGADAIHLPFPAQHFDAVISGFLLRNVSNLMRCLEEQQRVLKPGGWLVALDTTPPPETSLAPLLRFHLHSVIPTLGKLITGQAEAYRYLPDSTEVFLEPEQLAARLISAGFVHVGFKRLMLGTIAIHWAQRP
jgi:demethylmenaquinone methyltransferase/2-methoxy-6-polyprenyl-1,4-benzoquinol methylase